MSARCRVGAVGVLVLAGLSTPLWATSLCVSRDACDVSLQPFQEPIQHARAPGPTGFAYFDGFSWDAANENIAYFIEGKGAFLGNPFSPDAQLPYLGNSDGSAVTSFYFHNDGTPQVASLLVADGLWAPTNSLGWYDPNSSAWGWVFKADGTKPAPQTVSFNPTSNYGLFFVPNNLTFDPNNPDSSPAPVYYSNSALNGIAAADVVYASQNGIRLGPEFFQHFAVFADGKGGFYIGVKDRSLQVGDQDYNDLIFTLSDSPEPGSFWLGLGIFAFFVLRRRSHTSEAPLLTSRQ